MTRAMMRATLSGIVHDEVVTVEISADLWDRFRDLRLAMRMSESEMVRWLTGDGRIKATERWVEAFVSTLEKGKGRPRILA